MAKRRLSCYVVVTSVAALLIASQASATPIQSDLIQIGNATGFSVSVAVFEGSGAPCTVHGAGLPAATQCEFTNAFIGFSYLPNTPPADVGIFFTHADGSVSDLILADFPTASNQVGMQIFSDVDGAPFPTQAQFLTAFPNLPTTSIPETGGLQDLTALVLGLIPNPTLASQIRTAGWTFAAQSDLDAVPEPATLTLTVLGFAGVLACRRRLRLREHR